jgi:hypothetical protein
MENRKNEAIVDINLFNYLESKKSFSKKWTVKKSNNSAIQEGLDKSSKS